VNETSPSLVELRQYALRPGQRDVLVSLFERELIEPQEQVGMTVIGQFVDKDDPDRFVWLRGFADMRARRDALAAFYDGPVWAAHREAANATMIDSDNVLLLRPARPEASFELDGPRPSDHSAGETGVVEATIAYLETTGAEAAAIEAFARAIAPVVADAGGAVLGYFVTETSTNDFPRLPVREGERVLVSFAGFPEESTLDAAAAPLGEAVRTAFGELGIARVERLRLVPTARSLLTGRTAAPRDGIGEGTPR
jgi:hypothetical protein